MSHVAGKRDLLTQSKGFAAGAAALTSPRLRRDMPSERAARGSRGVPSQVWYPALGRRRASTIPAHLEKKTSNVFTRQSGQAASGGKDEGVRRSRSPADIVFSLFFFCIN